MNRLLPEQWQEILALKCTNLGTKFTIKIQKQKENKQNLSDSVTCPTEN